MKKLSFCMIATTLLFASCDYPTNNPKSIAMVSVVKPIDYGNGVFYFDAHPAQFGKSLSDFICKNKDQEVISISVNGASGFDKIGYFMVTRKKE